jgi:hypothetical protein
MNKKDKEHKPHLNHHLKLPESVTPEDVLKALLGTKPEDGTKKDALKKEKK